MLRYRNGEGSDPFFHIYRDPGWLRDYDPPRPFPFWVNIESTNHCNLDCIFCSRQLHHGPRGFMSDAVLDRIADEVRRHPPAAMRVAGWGEPLMHPRFAEHARRVKQAGIKLKIYTNGLLLTRENMESFIDAGVDEIQFSMQGLTPEQYMFNRRKARFDDFFDKVRLAADTRGRRNADRPFLSLLTSVLKSELEQADPEAFADRWIAYVDKVAVDLTNLHFVSGLPRVRDLLDDQALAPRHAPCVDVFLAIEVNHNGDIAFCGQDACLTPEHTIGNVTTMSISEAWHGDKMNAHREAVGRRMQHDRLPICRNCYPNTDKYDLFKQRYG